MSAAIAADRVGDYTDADDRARVRARRRRGHLRPRARAAGRAARARRRGRRRASRVPTPCGSRRTSCSCASGSPSSASPCPTGRASRRPPTSTPSSRDHGGVGGREDAARRIRRQGRARRAQRRRGRRVVRDDRRGRPRRARCSSRSSSTSAASSRSWSPAGPRGEIAAWPLVETVQVGGVCSEVIAPAPRSAGRLADVAATSRSPIAEGLGVTGVLAVELFETDRRPPARQRARDAPAQQRPLVDRRRRRPASSSSTCAPCSTCRSAAPARTRRGRSWSTCSAAPRGRRCADRYAAAFAGHPTVEVPQLRQGVAARSQGRARHRDRRRPRRRRLRGARGRGGVPGLTAAGLPSPRRRLRCFPALAPTLDQVTETNSSPLVGVVMGSDSDWNVMREASAAPRRVRRRARGRGGLGAPHAREDDRVRQGGRRSRPQGHHRRRRRRGAPARHARLGHHAAGDRRAGAARRASTGSTRCSRSCRCPPASPSRRSRSAARKNAGLLAVQDPRDVGRRADGVALADYAAALAALVEEKNERLQVSTDDASPPARSATRTSPRARS